MRFNTHGPNNFKLPKIFWTLFLIGIGMLYLIFAIGSFTCFYYAGSMSGGILVIMLPIIMTFWCWVIIRDMGKAYVEIHGDSICVVDYYLGFKKERMYSYTDITSGEIVSGYSFRVKGYRYSNLGIRYIILKKDNKYLFKIIYLPETECVFKRFLME